MNMCNEPCEFTVIDEVEKKKKKTNVPTKITQKDCVECFRYKASLAASYKKY